MEWDTNPYSNVVPLTNNVKSVFFFPATITITNTVHLLWNRCNLVTHQLWLPPKHILFFKLSFSQLVSTQKFRIYFQLGLCHIPYLANSKALYSFALQVTCNDPCPVNKTLVLHEDDPFWERKNIAQREGRM